MSQNRKLSFHLMSALWPESRLIVQLIFVLYLVAPL